jgi:Flp pilus assembly protein TadD
MNPAHRRLASRRGAAMAGARRLLLFLLVGGALGGCANTGGEESTPLPMLQIADSTQKGGDWMTSVVLYRRAHQLNPKRIEPLLALGRTLAAHGLPGAAAESFGAALALDSGNAEALRGHGKALLALERPAQAAARFAAALQIAADDIGALNGAAVALDMQGDHEAAQISYRRGLDLAPDDPTLLNNLGLSLAFSGNFEEAIAVLRKIALDPGATARQRQNLALAYGLAGEEAVAAEIARLDLDEGAVQRNLAFYARIRERREKGGIPAAAGRGAGFDLGAGQP